MSIVKSPTWLRAAQIGLGAIIIILSIMVLINPILGAVSVIWALGFLLLFAGIEKVISGIVSHGKSRFASIGLGIIVIIIALIAMSFPVAAGYFVIMLLAIALLVDGISRIVHSIRDNHSRTWSKGFSIGVGILSIILAIVVIADPVIGLALAGILIGVALLITGIQIISSGITGISRKQNSLE